MTVESFLCEWLTCDAAFDDPELLYNHLCNDHIGRKSTNNLCLTCRWKDCGTSCAKRDHITSHLRGIPPPLPLLLLALAHPFDQYTHPSSPMYARYSSPLLASPPLTPLRFARNLSSVPRTSKSTKRFTQKSTMRSTSTQRPSP